jgi:hypothetical protein
MVGAPGHSVTNWVAASTPWEPRKAWMLAASAGMMHESENTDLLVRLHPLFYGRITTIDFD